MWWHTVKQGRGSEGETGEWSVQPALFTLPRNMVYPALLPLMRTPRLPVVDWTDAPAGLNGPVPFAERRNLVSARVPSHFKRSLLNVTAAVTLATGSPFWDRPVLCQCLPLREVYVFNYVHTFREDVPNEMITIVHTQYIQYMASVSLGFVKENYTVFYLAYSCCTRRPLSHLEGRKLDHRQN